MGRIRILAVEDDAAVCRLLQHSLAREDYDLQIAGSGEEGLAMALAVPPALVLLDLGLPGIDGLEVCRQLRDRPQSQSVPIIILSGKGEESDVVRGLEMGADDYMVKPFSPRILNARLHAVLRRRDASPSIQPDSEVLEIAGLRVDPVQKAVLLAGAPLELSPVEYRFVYLLVRYLCLDQDPEREAEIGMEGTALYAENRLERLQPVFDALLAAQSTPQPVLAVFAAMAMQTRDSERCRQLLEGARLDFERRSFTIGELATCALLVPHHLLFDGDTDAALAALQRVDALYLDLFPSLSSYARIIVAQALALGAALLFGDFRHAQEHLAIAEALVEERSLVNLAVVNHLIRNLELSMCGQLVELDRGIEATLRLRTHPQVSAAHRALLCLCQLCDLELHGAFDYLHQLQGAWQVEFAALFPPQSLLRQRLIVAQAEAALWRRDVAGARALLRTTAADRGLLSPLLAGLDRLCAALSGEAVTLPAGLVWEDGTLDVGTFAVGQGALFTTRALMAAGREVEAEELLAKLSTHLAERPWSVLQMQSVALELLAALTRDQALESGQLQQLQWLLREMRQRRLIQLSALLPQDLEVLFKAASAAQLEANYVDEYARRRLCVDLSETGEALPLLALQTLGGVEVTGQTDGKKPGGKFSRHQRECLALLVAAPNGQIDQEEMQLLFWPDSSPEKGRSNLDTMLSRLRKTLQEKIAPLQAKDYLKLQKGMVSLEHVDVDVHRLLAGLRRGQDSLGKGELWQADLAFAEALSYWRGAYASGGCSSDRAVEFAERVHLACLEATLRWAEVLIDSGQGSRAEAVLLQAIGNDRGNEALVRALYRCYMRDGRIKRALDLLQGYGEVLRRDGCTPAEIARTLAAIKVRTEVA